MEVSKLIESIEKLFYSLLMTVVLIPKTIFKIFVPNWSSKYIDQQFECEEENRFNNYISPVILSMILIVLPIYYSLNYGTSWAPLDENRTDFFSRIVTNSEMPIIDKFIIIGLIFNIYPILFTTTILVLNKKEVNKVSFKPYYYKFLYSFCAIYSSFIFLFISLFFSDEYATLDFILFIFSIILFLYTNVSTIITNFNILKKSLNNNKYKSGLTIAIIYPIVIVIYGYLFFKIISVVLAHFIDD